MEQHKEVQGYYQDGGLTPKDIKEFENDILLMKSIIEDKNKLKELNDLLISANCICSFINEGTMIPKIIIESIENYR